MNFYLIRHGETDWNLVRRMQGHSDIPLNANGILQAKGLPQKIQNLQISAVFASDLNRAMETARLMNSKKLPLVFHPALREVHLGDAEGMTREEIIGRWGEDFFAKWSLTASHLMDQKFPNGETKQEAVDRFTNFIKQQLHQTQETKTSVVFVSHGLIIRTFLQHHFPEQTEGILIKNCDIIEMSYVDQQFKFIPR
jgi:broad specificity phosphatase PhoE